LIALRGASRNKMPIATNIGVQSKNITRHTTKPVVPKPPRDSDGVKNRAGCKIEFNKNNILKIVLICTFKASYCPRTKGIYCLYRVIDTPESGSCPLGPLNLVN